MAKYEAVGTKDFNAAESVDPASSAAVLAVLRELMQAVERCEDNDFSEASRKNLAIVADHAALITSSLCRPLGTRPGDFR